MNTDDARNARIFKAFCDENRLRVLTLLQSGEMCTCVLIRRLGLKQSALSYHMKVLVDAGIVVGRPDGKWTHYRLSAEGVRLRPGTVSTTDRRSGNRRRVLRL